MSRLPLAAVYVVISSIPAHAVDRTWDGSSGSYNTPASWTGSVVPVGGDKAIINSGTVSVGSADPDWSTTAGISLGTNGTLHGTLNQSDKTVTSSGEVWVGQGTGANAAYNLSGGIFNVSNWLAVGRASGTGTLTISGGTLNKTNGGNNFVIGSGKDANGVVVQTGGTVNNTASETWIAEQSNLPGGSGDGSANGSYTLSGTGVANLGLLTLGRSGTGTATFNLDGGTLSVSRINKAGGGNTGIFNFNGGTLKARQNEDAFLQGITTANIKGGGAIIDSANFAVQIGQSLLDSDPGNGDSLTKRGTGSLSLSGTNTFSGTITVEQGALTGRTTASLPGWNVADHIVVKSGGALGATLGGAGFSQADFETLLSSADMQAGSSVAIDTTGVDHSYTTNLGDLPTGLGNAIGLHKTGTNALTLSMGVQTFTGDILSQRGNLILSGMAATQTNNLYVNSGATLTLENTGDRTFSNVMTGGGTYAFTGNGNKTLANGGTFGALVKGGSGSLTFSAAGTTTNGNFVSSGGVINLGGATLSVGGETQVGQGGGANSTLKVAAGDTLIANNWLAVGRGGGTGILEISGGTITKQGGGSVIIGARDGGQSNGTVNQTGGTFTVNNGEFWIGQNGNDAANKSVGTYNLSNGTVTTNSWLAIGREGGNGTLNISGGTFTKQGNDHVEIGGTGTNGATGLLNISGGTFNQTSGETRIGLSTAGSGTLTVSGSGVANLGVVKLSYANNGTGTMNLNGGTTTVQRIEKSSGGNAVVNFNGGVLKAKANEVAFLGGLNSANVLAGGAKIDTNGFDVTVNQALLAGTGNGGLTKSGTGKLTLTGVSTYTGTTSVESGTLAVTGTGSFNASTQINVASGATLDVTAATGFTIGSAQTLSGPGTVAGAMTVAGTLSPGSSPGTLNTGSQTWSNGGDYNFQMLNTTGVTGTGWDLVSITGTLNLASLAGNGFNINLWTLASTGPDVNGNALNFDNTQNQSWTIASASGGITGFNAANFVINTSAFNGTGGWTNGLNGGNFSLGTSGNNLVLNFNAVPEPGAALLVALSGLGLLRRRRNA